MLLKKPVVDAINTQVGEELFASHQYKAIALHFDRETLPELSQYFHIQSQEEHSHAMKMLQYLNDMNEHAMVPAVAAPKNHFEAASECVELALNQEIKVTKQINSLVEMAMQENDHLTQEFLCWFVSEQIEEMSSMSDLLDVVKRAGEDNLLRVEEFLSRHPHSGANGA